MMARKDGFTRTLKEQRMTLKQFAKLGASNFPIQNQAYASKIFIKSDTAASTRERSDGTIMRFYRMSHYCMGHCKSNVFCIS